MKNLIKALGIAGITALSFIPMRSKGQEQLDSIKYYVFGEDKESILEARYYHLSPKNFGTRYASYKKNEKEYYKIVPNKFKTYSTEESLLLKNREEAVNLFIYSKEYWTPGGEYIYDKNLNLIRICAKINGPKLVN